MKKLFIIGNGFDIAHSLPTHFCYFKKFLEEECGGELSYMPETRMGRDGETIADRKSTAGLLIDLVDNTTRGNDWEDFEESMGRFNYLQYFDEYDMNEAIQADNDNEMYRVAYAREDLASDLSLCVGEIKELFSEWIDTIDISAAKRQPRFIKLFDADAEFLTFNYTMTLEEIYGIAPSKICHIHGQKGGSIVVGHGIEHNPYEEESLDTFAIDWSLVRLFESLKKDVVGCYRQHYDFFQKFKWAQVEEIYSFGSALSKQDCFYISELCKLIDTSNVVWHLSAFDEDKNDLFMERIRECGFKGTFGTLIPC